MRWIAVAILSVWVCGCASIHNEPLDEDVVRSSLRGQPGGFILIDTESKHVLRVDGERCAERLPPCSTFKIWNTMIALELGLLSSPNEAFWTWDGQKRFLDAWNQDMTLQQAFTVSCVPAFQVLAGRIGPKQMQTWLRRINYGDKDISAGISQFWLPDPERKTILISANEQAMLLRHLVRGELPFLPDKVSVLREIMRVRTTTKGELFGKTGTGKLDDGLGRVAWFVGWVESGTEKRCRTFSCVVRGKKVTGLDVRAIVEALLESGGLL